MRPRKVTVCDQDHSLCSEAIFTEFFSTSDDDVVDDRIGDCMRSKLILTPNPSLPTDNSRSTTRASENASAQIFPTRAHWPPPFGRALDTPLVPLPATPLICVEGERRPCV